MASTGISDIQALDTRLREERVSRELQRVESNSTDEKKDIDGLAVNAVEYETTQKKSSLEEDEFIPYDIHSGKQFDLDTLPAEEGTGFTWRAVIIGQLLGLVIAASNVYLGLKTGFTFGAGLFGALAGCALIKAMVKIGIPARFGGAPFGPRENVTVQSAATAAGSLTGMFVAAIPAAAQLGLLRTPSQDFARLFTFTLCSAYYGVFFAIPLRKFVILRQKLVFPSATATALTIRAIHAPGGDIAMKKKTKALMLSFVISFVFVIVRQYAAGILDLWDLGCWIYLTQGAKGAWALYGRAWGWGVIELTPAFFGAGMLSGMNASYSFLFGSVLAWGIIGPAAERNGLAFGRTNKNAPEGISLKTFTSMNPNPRPTPRYWLLWVGVAIMLFYSIAELLLSGPAIYRALKGTVVEAYYSVTKKERVLSDKEQEEANEFEDPVPRSQQVQNWSWPLGWLLSSVVTVLVCALQFHMNAGNVILSIFLAFVFSFVAVSCSGVTDINPVGTVAKMSQLVVGGAIKTQHKEPNAAKLENLLAGSIASSAAGHAVDMISDLKTGHLCRASPRSQYYAQLWGSIAAIPFSVGMYVLFASAYPCVVDGALFDEGDCAFSAPAVVSWRFISEAVVTNNAIPFSAGMVALGMGLFAAAFACVKHFFIPKKYHKYLINFNAAGLAFVSIDPSQVQVHSHSCQVPDASAEWRRALFLSQPLPASPVASPCPPRLNVRLI